MHDSLKIAPPLFIVLVVCAAAVFDLTPQAQVKDNVTVIYKTNPHWPVRGAISADPCPYPSCLHV